MDGSGFRNSPPEGPTGGPALAHAQLTPLRSPPRVTTACLCPVVGSALRGGAEGMLPSAPGAGGREGPADRSCSLARRSPPTRSTSRASGTRAACCGRWRGWPRPAGKWPPRTLLCPRLSPCTPGGGGRHREEGGKWEAASHPHGIQPSRGVNPVRHVPPAVLGQNPQLSRPADGAALLGQLFGGELGASRQTLTA